VGLEILVGPGHGGLLLTRGDRGRRGGYHASPFARSPGPARGTA
jgi:hypothetical protein